MNSTKPSFGDTLIGIIFVVFILACGFGYVANIVRLIASLSWMEMTRILSIFLFPIGVVMGYVSN